MSEDPTNFDWQQLQLEKDKLAFEVRKYDEERLKREKELEKIDAEVKTLKLPWYKSPLYSGPLVTIGVAILGGILGRWPTHRFPHPHYHKSGCPIHTAF